MIFFVSTSRLYLYKQFFSFYWGSDSFQSLKCTYMLTHLISLTYSNLGALFFCVNKIFIHVTDGTFFSLLSVLGENVSREVIDTIDIINQFDKWKPMSVGFAQFASMVRFFILEQWRAAFKWGQFCNFRTDFVGH